uniref:Predicted protein n=1 Tax=Hordeum vulgare subsp. vulgare TaxID=112509 RepID=F2DXF8_HORVV|nr:predicted protein [Hordeum vulgare subsp. vulgare]
MCERWGYSWGSGLRRLYWDSASQTVKNEPIYTDTAGAITNVGIWEHGCFSRGGSANVLPGGFSFCFYVDKDSSYGKLSAVQLTKTITDNWGISGVPSSITFPATGLPTANDGAMTIAFVQDSGNSFYLQIVNSAASGGSVDLSLAYNGPVDSNMLVRIQNNPSDSYLWDGKTGRFQWTWTSGTTGVVIGPINAIIALTQFSFTFTINSATGVSTANIVGNNNVVKSYTISSAPTFTLSRISCQCGSGVDGDDPILKECEYSGSSTPCCTPDCHYKLNNNLCQLPTDNCTGPSYCTGKSATCPPLQIVSACNCTFPYYGYGCTQVRCDKLTDCGSCNTYSQCSYCCSGTSSYCTASSSCSTKYPSNCPVCPACANGTCQCGSCVCDPGYGGTNCDLIVDCTGNPVPQGDTPKKIDICGVCGGNGTSCIGCDGIPFGLKYDNCGICGGDGSSCYNPCPGSTCQECTASDICGWCPTDSKCYPKTNNGACGDKLLTADQGKLGISICDAQISTAAIVGAALGTAAIVGIAVGGAALAVIGVVGGKKGYDAYMKHKTNMSGAQSNPMYNDTGRTGNNPFYNTGVEMKNV